MRFPVLLAICALAFLLTSACGKYGKPVRNSEPRSSDPVSSASPAAEASSQADSERKSASKP